MLRAAWDSEKATTITNYFRKSGFIMPIDMEDIDDDNEEKVHINVLDLEEVVTFE